MALSATISESTRPSSSARRISFITSVMKMVSTATPSAISTLRRATMPSFRPMGRFCIDRTQNPLTLSTLRPRRSNWELALRPSRWSAA